MNNDSPGQPFFTFSNWKFTKQHDNNNKLSKRHLGPDFFTSRSPDVSLELALRQLDIKSTPTKVSLKPVSISPTESYTKTSLLTWLKSQPGNGFLQPSLEPENLQFHEPPSRRKVPKSKFKNQENISEKQENTFMVTNDKVIILWDLDNKVPRDPYNATMLLTRFARLFGRDVKISAFGNSSTWSSLPRSIKNERIALQKRYKLEEQGIIAPSEPYICGVCDKQYKFRKDLQTHFELHEHEYNEIMDRISSSKSRPQKLCQFLAYEKQIKNYREASRHESIAGLGVGLVDELGRAGVVVHCVRDISQAADRALERAWELHGSRNKGPYDWLFLVSDDKDFCKMLDKARKRGVGIVTVCNKGVMSTMGDFWIPWTLLRDGNQTLDCMARFVLNRTSENNRVGGNMISTQICDNDGGQEVVLIEEKRLEIEDESIEERFERALEEQRVTKKQLKKSEKILKKERKLERNRQLMEGWKSMEEKLSMDIISDEELLLRLNDSDFIKVLKRMANYPDEQKRNPENRNSNKDHLNKRKWRKPHVVNQRRAAAEAAKHRRRTGQTGSLPLDQRSDAKDIKISPPQMNSAM
ncbi:hypothetical protein DID88_004545 [Monilinia fructigena]|uniref:C2H2-type domain-containing protein n=1 Tax=Monilinia fructigena TaxID=38457 RepID=A0A395IQZ6_9HELO|nr:hypothetical protein DID88_004545 [Monilinia fructigena]